MKDNRWILYTQVVLIILLVWLSDLENIFTNIILLAFLVTGCGVLISAFFNIGIKFYSPFPEPKKDGFVSQKGLYKYVRHPMYAGILILGLTFVLSSLKFESFLIFLFLIYVLNMKADLEEELLYAKHPQYADYKNKTKKFIPYIL